MTRILAAGNDAVRLLEHLCRHGTDRTSGPRIQALRQIVVQNYHWDAAGRLRSRTAEKESGAGLPQWSRAVVSPYDISARYARHGHIISWKGFFAHLAETCALDGPNMITDVARTEATTAARFTKNQCRPCPVRVQCSNTDDSDGAVGFPSRKLRDLQLRVRTEQQTPEWKARYAVRSGVEGAINEFTHGHGRRRCPNRGETAAHIQHVLTAIAVNIERLSQLP